jgi:RNA polymerase sigma factor (sigma-70 family)
MTREAFNDIIHLQYRRLYYVAFRILRNSQEAEDIVQDVFLKMWMMRDKLDKYNDIGALAVTMTRNSSIDMFRKWKKMESNNDNPEILNPGLSSSPHDQLVNSESSGILNEIIDNLPGNYREIVQLREVEGLSYEEIEVRTKISINNLRVILSRARRIIKVKYLNYSNERGKTERAPGKVL